jgi:hypothetical protein
MGAVTRGFISALGAVLFAAATDAETVYYAVSEGENYDKQTWRSGDLKTLKQNRPENVFDLYTFRQLGDGSSRVTRERSTPSGDWFLTLTYYYAKNGRLTKMDYDFRTFNGLCPCGETGPVRCERFYSVDHAGKLRKTSERIIEMKTGAAVDWTFSEPAVRHWARISDLPIRPH